MLSITVGGGLFGFIGMLLSVPTFALIYAIVRTVIERRLREKALPEATESYVDAPEGLAGEGKK
jgi:predicted PurR-regulated permease PerM